jgi:hypothetical protein
MTLLIVTLAGLVFVVCLGVVGWLWRRQELARTVRQWDERERVLDRKRPVAARAEIRQRRARPRA